MWITFLLLLGLCPCFAARPIAVPQIALIQYDGDAHLGDSSLNLSALERLSLQAIAKGAKILVFPEGSLAGYATETETWCRSGMSSCEDHACRDVSLVSEPIPGGKTTRYWEKFAADHHVYVIFNLPEIDGSSHYDTSAVIAPEGYLTKYRKRHLYYLDTCYATSGSQETLFNTEYGKFGILICADVNDPGFLTDYKAHGAQAVLLPTDWDEAPDAGSSRAAMNFFASQAKAAAIDIYASDQPAWDGTGAYLGRGGNRVRLPLPSIAVGKDGFTLQPLK